MTDDAALSPSGEGPGAATPAIDPRALDRFREIAAMRNAANSAVYDVDRRRNDTIVHLQSLRMERDRVAAVRYWHHHSREEQSAKVAVLDAEIATVKSEYDRLAVEGEKLRERLNGIGQLYCGCRDYLISTHGMSRKDLED